MSALPDVEIDAQFSLISLIDNRQKYELIEGVLQVGNEFQMINMIKVILASCLCKIFAI